MIATLKFIGVILLMMAMYVGFIILLMVAAINMGVVGDLWDHPTAGVHIKLWAWNTVLTINVFAPLVISCYALFRVLFGLRRKS